MQIRLNNSNISLLIPKDYSEVDNAEELYGELYHKRSASDVRMFQNVTGFQNFSNTFFIHYVLTNRRTKDLSAEGYFT